MTSEPARGLVLREFDLFRDLADDEVAAIGEAALMRALPAGQLLYSPTRPTEVLFILRSGRVRLYVIGPDGRTLTTAIVESGELFGEMVPLGQSLTDTSAETLEPCIVCPLSRQDVERLLLADPRIAARIAEILGRRVAELETRLSDTVLRSAPERIASTLARMAGHEGADVRLTHEQLADLVGTSRETVTKVLGDLADRRLVRLRRGRVDVTDGAGLRSLIESGGLNPVTGGGHRR